MTRQEFSDEMLVAYADGELDASTSAAIASALEHDPELAGRLAVFRTTRDVLRTTLGSVEREPVPDRLTQFVMAGGRSRGNERPLRKAAAFVPRIAAALAFIVAGAGGYWLGSQRGAMPDRHTIAATAAAAEPQLQRLLAAAPDGTSRTWSEGGRSGEMVVRGTYRTRVGLCRSYALNEGTDASIGGVACKGASGWQTQVLGLARSSDGSITPAGSTGAATEAFLDTVDAEDPLGAEAVQKLIANGWR